MNLSSEIEEFIRRVVPWPTDANGGFINLHWLRPGKNGFSGRPYTKIDEFMSMAQWLTTQPTVAEHVYFCLSSQRYSGRQFKGTAIAARSQKNAIFLKSIWLDIDVKPDQPGKAYPTTEAALDALGKFLADTQLPRPSAIVYSGSGGLHVYWISDKPLTVAEWKPYANGFYALAERHGLLADPITTDSARVLRVPGTLNYKKNPPGVCKIARLAPEDLNFSVLNDIRLTEVTAAVTSNVMHDPALFPIKTPVEDELSKGIHQYDDTPLDYAEVFKGCPHFQDAWKTGGKDYPQGLWMLDALATTFLQDGRALARLLSKGYANYSVEETDAMFDRKMAERQSHGLGWPSCGAFENAGCKSCAQCLHKGKIKSPLHLALPQQTGPAQPLPPEFVDPYGDFAGPAFPLEVLPPTLAAFVDAEQRAMGADPSAIAMAALTVVAGAMHAETLVHAGEGWWERPIMWTALVGQPSTKKSPIIDKTKKPLSSIDRERDKRWRQEYAIWQKQNQGKKANKPPAPGKLPRCILNDVTPEKVAEILSRDPSGSLMVHDELAGWLDSFERYSGGQSARAFHLSCWNGGHFNKDRIARGVRDPAAEISIDNLALCILGGIQPDRLARIRDLTSDGLLQRFLPVLMRPAGRGDEYHPVESAEADYEKLIRAISAAAPEKYHFADEALEIRGRVLDHLHRLELTDGFPAALIGAIGKLKGYFARLCLVLQVARKHDPASSAEARPGIPDNFTPEVAERLNKLLGVDPKGEPLGAGISAHQVISKQTAEAAEKLLSQFLLPHTFGLYDVVVNSGQDRDMVRSIGDFILASNKDRLRPSDITGGVRALRGHPEQKIREWMGRFWAMGWVEPEEGKPGVPPKAWRVLPELRGHFAERRKQSQAAKAAAHAILKAGGSRKAA